MVASVASNGSVVYYDTLSAVLDKVGSGSTLKLLKDFTSDKPISISKGSSVFYLDLNGHTVNTLKISSYIKLKDTAANGSIGTLTCSDSFLGATLASGWSFKKGFVIWLPADDLFRNSATTVAVAQAQITGVAARSGEPVPFGSDATVEAIPLPEGLSVLSYQWYESIGGTWVKIAGANSSTYTSNTLSLGDHYFTCAVKGVDGATVLIGGGSATITQASIENATVNVIAPTYNGSAQTPTVTVTLGDKTLVKDTDYGVSVDEQTDAGNYTLTITGMGNYTGTKDADWTIQPKTLTITDAIIGPKHYDGTTDAEVTEVTFNGLAEGESLALDTGFTATGAFDTPNAGTDKNVTVTVTLNDSVKNYTLGKNNSITLRNGYLQKNTEIGFDDMKLVISNGLSTTYEIDLPDLPELDAPKGTAVTEPILWDSST